MRTLWDKVGMQDGLRCGLQPDPLLYNLVAPGDLAPQSQGLRVRYPNFWQEVARIKFRQNRCVNLVCLDLGVGNHANLQGIRDCNTRNVRFHDICHRSGITRCLYNNMVIVSKRSCKRLQMLPRHADTAKPLDPYPVKHHRLRKDAMDIQSYHSHLCLLACWFTFRELAGNTAITDPRSQRIRASRRGDQITARALSPCSNERPARTCVLPAPHVPDGLTITPIQLEIGRTFERQSHHAG
jgi:hypothetical protein